MPRGAMTTGESAPRQFPGWLDAALPRGPPDPHARTPATMTAIDQRLRLMAAAPVKDVPNWRNEAVCPA